MKARSVVTLVGLAISFALPIFSQEKEGANPFLYRAILATPQLAQQLDPINSQWDEDCASKAGKPNKNHRLTP